VAASSRKEAFEALARAVKDKNEVRILFVCGANICRSPYAEMRFEQMISEKPLPKKIIVSSGGFMQSPQLHEFTRRALLEGGLPASKIDRFTPRSMRKHKDELESADFIFSPTREVIEALLPRKYHHKAFLLSVARGIDDEIADPFLIPEYGQYKPFLDRIDACLAEIIQALRKAWAA